MILSLDTQRDIRNAALSALHYIAYDQHCEVSDILALLVTTPKPSVSGPDEAKTASAVTTTPSQPRPSSSPVSAPAPVAQAAGEATDDAGESSSLPSEPSVAPIPEADVPVSPQGTLAGDPADGAASPPNPGPTPSAAFSSPKFQALTRAEQITAVNAEHPDWPAKLIAEAIGTTRENVQAKAYKHGIVLPKQSAYEAAQAAKTAAALSAGLSAEQPPADTAGPAKGKRIPLADKIRAHLANHPNATARDIADATGGRITSVTWAAIKAGIVLRKFTPEEQSEAISKAVLERNAQLTSMRPAVERDASDVLHAVRRPANPKRFYLRDRAGLFVHQSLSQSPAGPGPMMTNDRKWAWFDNIERYRGAKRRWPQLADMRKEAAQP